MSERRFLGLVDDRLAEIRAALEAITPGEWRTQRSISGKETIVLVDDGYLFGGAPEYDVAFIAAAPTYVTELLGEVERLRLLLNHFHETA